MALRRSFSIKGVARIATEYGDIEQANTFVVLNAYIKVEEVKASKSEALAFVSMTDGTKRIAKTVLFEPTMDGGNFIAQAYEHLKTLPEFEGATDC